MYLMGYEMPTHWSAHFFKEQILRIATPNARVRVTVWRSPGGLYAPQNHQPQFLITAKALDSAHFEWQAPGLSLGRCDGIRLPLDQYSGLKTLNAARYVAAAVEARRKDYDDVVILNTSGHVCESTMGNLFWWEGDTLCTPPLSDGPLTGIMRNLLLVLRSKSGISTCEKSVDYTTFCQADEVFLSNAVRGILPVQKIENKALATDRTYQFFEALVNHFKHLLT
jgi:branched-chain amino acid aminotransferase